MRHIFGAIGLILGFAGAAQAQETRLAALMTGDDARGWEAVGRLEIAGKGFCTGALIAPDLVLTAAHCLFDRDGGTQIDPSRIEFQAGLRNGRALAYRDVRRAVVPAAYVFDGQVSDQTARADVALLELAQPIRSARIIPFDTVAQVSPRAHVAVVSYALDRADAPSLQDLCGMLGQSGGVLVLTCDVDFGSSGAPVFAVEDGVARIVSVISAKAELDGEQVALGTLLDGPLAELQRALAGTGGVLHSAAPPRVRVIGSGERAETGAKFVRP